jgi:flagellar protein FliS
MAIPQAYAKYMATSVQTASPERLLIMLYEGLLKSLRISISALEQKDLATAHRELTRSQDIVRELQSSLRMEFEISHALSALYDYFYRRLVDANVRKDPQPVVEILPRVEELHEAWVLAAKKLKEQAADAQPVEADV